VCIYGPFVANIKHVIFDFFSISIISCISTLEFKKESTDEYSKIKIWKRRNYISLKENKIGIDHFDKNYFIANQYQKY
jgi:hypothetical protein